MSCNVGRVTSCLERTTVTLECSVRGRGLARRRQVESAGRSDWGSFFLQPPHDWHASFAVSHRPPRCGLAPCRRTAGRLTSLAGLAPGFRPPCGRTAQAATDPQLGSYEGRSLSVSLRPPGQPLARAKVRAQGGLAARARRGRAAPAPFSSHTVKIDMHDKRSPRVTERKKQCEEEAREHEDRGERGTVCLAAQTTNSSGFMLSLHRRASSPPSWTTVLTPSKILICVNPISCETLDQTHQQRRPACRSHPSASPLTLMNSSFVYSAKASMPLTTRNKVPTMSTAA